MLLPHYDQELFVKLNRMASIAAEMFVGRERFAMLLLMRLTETVILWLSKDQIFWDDIEGGPKPLGSHGLQQVFKSNFHPLIYCVKMTFYICVGSNALWLNLHLVLCKSKIEGEMEFIEYS